jgi:hypothetical protein
MWIPSESAMLSATAITSKEPITPAFGLPEVSNPKIIPKLVTVDDVAPKLNLLGSLGIFTSSLSNILLLTIKSSQKKEAEKREATFWL